MNKYFSKARLEKVSTQEYIDNIRVSMDMYPLLHVFEVALRNRIAKFIGNKFGKSFVKNFLLGNSTLKLTRAQENKIYETYNRITNNKIKRGANDKYPYIAACEEYILDENDLISNISLGFWIICLKESFINNNGLAKICVLQEIFGINHNIINSKKRTEKYDEEFKKVETAMELIHNARNRIYHYESILNHKSYHHKKLRETLIKYISRLEYKKNDLFYIIV